MATEFASIHYLFPNILFRFFFNLKIFIPKLMKVLKVYFNSNLFDFEVAI